MDKPGNCEKNSSAKRVVKNFAMPKTPYKIGAMKKNQVYKRIYCF